MAVNRNVTNSITLKTGLAFETYTVVGTFKGVDPANVTSNGAGTARGAGYMSMAQTAF